MLTWDALIRKRVTDFEERENYKTWNVSLMSWSRFPSEREEEKNSFEERKRSDES